MLSTELNGNKKKHVFKQLTEIDWELRLCLVWVRIFFRYVAVFDPSVYNMMCRGDLQCNEPLHCVGEMERGS